MKCQILFSGKNKKNISKCRLLKILLRVLSVNCLVNIWTGCLDWFINLLHQRVSYWVWQNHITQNIQTSRLSKQCVIRVYNVSVIWSPVRTSSYTHNLSLCLVIFFLHM